MHMKWLIRLAFPALGVLLLLIFFGVGGPVDTVSTPGNTTSTKDIPAFEGLVPSPIPTKGPEIIFKWRDDEGSWHFADSPPESGNWNALAIEPADEAGRPTASADPEPDWQTPYAAPFFLDGNPANNGS